MLDGAALKNSRPDVVRRPCTAIARCGATWDAAADRALGRAASP